MQMNWRNCRIWWSMSLAHRSAVPIWWPTGVTGVFNDWTAYRTTPISLLCIAALDSHTSMDRAYSPAPWSAAWSVWQDCHVQLSINHPLLQKLHLWFQLEKQTFFIMWTTMHLSEHVDIRKSVFWRLIPVAAIVFGFQTSSTWQEIIRLCRNKLFRQLSNMISDLAMHPKIIHRALQELSKIPSSFLINVVTRWNSNSYSSFRNLCWSLTISRILRMLNSASLRVL